MSTSTPDEAPHYRGKTLSPESPRPTHIPEPSSIPVLERQFDPVFNLMSTHTESPSASTAATALIFQQEQRPTENGTVEHTSIMETGRGFDGMQKMQESSSTSPEDDHIHSIINTDAIEDGAKQSEPPYNELQSTPLAHPNSSFDVAHDIPSTPSHVESALPSSNPTQADAPSEPSPDPHPPSSASTVNMEQSTSVPHADDAVNLGKNTDEPLNTEGGASADVAEEGDHLQLLIDSLTHNTASTQPEEKPVPSNNAASEPKSATDPVNENAIAPSTTTLPAPIGLPPRPPPQEKPAIHPNYSSTGDIRSFHPNPPSNSQHSLPSNSYRPTQAYQHPLGPPGTISAGNGLPPPPPAGFQQAPRAQHSQTQQSPTSQPLRSRDGLERNGSSQSSRLPEGGRFSPALERKYEEFLNQERVFVSEGVWDRFPHGSRLFIGNLPTEPASKRELFSIFQNYGALAQISIKQAYGFIQFLETQSCQEALRCEQGFRMRDRNLHLEISKPQKNARGAGQTSERDRVVPGPSRSPDYGRRPGSRDQGSRFTGDRYIGGAGGLATDFRDPPRRRDDYRPARSPSPRGFRGRDDYRDSRARSPDRYYGGGRHRSRSPGYGRGPVRYRSPSPRRHDGLGGLSTGLPGLPQRSYKDMPEVQIVLLEDLDRAFVSYVEKAFRDRGLKSDVTVSSIQMLPSVLERLIVDGIGSVVRLSRASAVSARIPLQVFDHSSAPKNVRFEEYENLEPHVAAELVVLAKSKRSAHPSQSSVPPTPTYGSLQYPPQQQLPTPTTTQPNIANLITSLDGPSLQQLLSAMQQRQQPQPPTPTTPQNPLSHQVIPQNRPAQAADLVALLANAGRLPPNAQGPPQAMSAGYQYSAQAPQAQAHPAQQPQYGYQPPNSVQQQASQFQAPSQYNAGAQAQQNVQDIMDKLKMWKQ